MKGSQTMAITITRQMASGGAYIGQLLAKRFGFLYLDRRVLHEASLQLGADERELECCEERASGFWEGIMKAFCFGTPEAAFIPPVKRPVYDRDLYEAEAEIITKTARTCNTVVVGRGGIHALREHPRTLHLFFHAPREFRVLRLMKVHDISDKKTALSLIDESDSQRERFFRTMTGLDWTDARNYHLCLDTSRTGLTEAEEVIAGMVEHIKKQS